MRDKIRFMTDLLEERFQRKMLSHRAGRWGLNAVYARLLVEHGYLVDCSVTPHISWSEYLGDPNGRGGPDFTRFPEQPYFVDLDRIDRPGDSPLLEVPVSVIKTRYAGFNARMKSSPKWLRRISRRISRRIWPPILSMIPRDNERSFRYMRNHIAARGRSWQALRDAGDSFLGVDARRKPVFSHRQVHRTALRPPGNSLFLRRQRIPRNDAERIQKRNGYTAHLAPGKYASNI